MDGGWHPDPLGRYSQRYHDGSGWTGYVSNRGGVIDEDPDGIDPDPPAPLGSPGARLVAAFIDGLIFAVPYLVYLIGANDWSLPQEVSDPSLWELAIVSGAVFLYDTLMVGRYGRTIGKMAAGLTIVTKEERELPGYGIAAVRAVAFAVFYSTPYLAYLMALILAIRIFIDPLRRTPHDLVARTVVVKTSGLSPRMPQQ